MNARERMECVWHFQEPDRVPFVPAVYEQKAFLIQDTPSRVSRDPELFYRAMMVEHETYQADALVVGMDVYNLEAEAVGSKVTYYEGDDTSIPGIRPDNHALKFGENLTNLKTPDPYSAGRMPINIDVSRRMAALNETVPVRGAVSGPFSLAISLLGAEQFFLGTLDDPDYCQHVLSFCADTIVAFGKAYLEAGVGVIMFDSQASPELLSPKMYQQLVLPHTKRAITELFEAGETVCPLIIGGNTTHMLDSYLETGSRQLLCDFAADWAKFRSACEQANMSVRRNMNPTTIQKGSVEELARVTRKYLEEAQGMDGFIVGTAVVPYGSPTENLLAVRDVCLTTA